MTKSDREIMEIFEAYDLTETVWSAATLTGHDPKTVKRYVEARADGRNPYEREPQPKMIDAFLSMRSWRRSRSGSSSPRRRSAPMWFTRSW